MSESFPTRHPAVITMSFGWTICSLATRSRIRVEPVDRDHGRVQPDTARRADVDRHLLDELARRPRDHGGGESPVVGREACAAAEGEQAAELRVLLGRRDVLDDLLAEPIVR